MRRRGGKDPLEKVKCCCSDLQAPTSGVARGGHSLANRCSVQSLPEKVTPIRRTNSTSAKISVSKENTNNKIECSGVVPLNCCLMPLGSNRLAGIGRGERAACASCVPAIVF